MNILFLINYAGKAGIEKYVENLVDIFTNHGESCHFAYNIAGELSKKMEKRNIPILKINMEKTKIRQAAKELATYCRRNKIDVIHPQCPRENIVAILSTKYYKTPKVVYTNHFTNVTGTTWKILNKYFTPKNHRIIAVCRAGKTIMERNGVCSEKIQVIYNGVKRSEKPVRDRSALSEFGIDDNTFVMNILARFEPEKGLPYLLDAVNRLKQLTDKPFKCVICGDGSLFAEVKAMVSEMKLDDCVVLTGYRTDTAKILAASDIYLNSSSCNEAMSFAILESMSAGLPCVVTDIGGNRDLAESGQTSGIVCDYGDVEAFAQGMLLLLNDEKLRKEYSNAAFEKLSTEFDLDKLAMDILESYK